MQKLVNLLKDLILPYKNFVGWNISKIMIFLASFGFGLIGILFFVIIAFFLSFYDSINWYGIYNILINTNSGLNNPEILEIFSQNKFFSIIYIILTILAFSTFFILYNYSNFLLSKLHLNYIRKENSLEKKLDFFNLKNIYKYFMISLNFILYLFLPVLLFLAGYFIILLIFPEDQRTYNIFDNFLVGDNFSISLVSLIVISIFYFIYIFYKTIFSYVILADRENYLDKLKYPFYIKESHRLTKGFKNFFIFIILFFLLFFISTPIFNIGKNIKNSLINNIELLNTQYKIIPFILKKEVKNQENIKKNIYNIRKNTQKNLIVYIFYKILYFLIFLGIFNMFITSFYERFLIINRSDIFKEKYKEGNLLIKKKIKIIKKKKE